MPKLFCGYCGTNGRTPSYCGKKIRDEEVKNLQKEATAGKNVTVAQYYNKRHALSHGSENWTSRDRDDETRRSLAYAKQL